MAPDYGKIIVYSFPRSMVIYGPPQIDAIIDQDPTVAERFTLWNQVGSEVERGKLIIFPIEGTVVYIQPVYLKASARLKIPQLQRLIVTQGDVVVMDASLENAVKTMVERLNAREDLGGRRIEPPQPALPIPQVSEPQVTQPQVTRRVTITRLLRGATSTAEEGYWACYLQVCLKTPTGYDQYCCPSWGCSVGRSAIARCINTVTQIEHTRVG